MRFFVRKRRQTPTVIIVALIDILIVMLIFLMVTTTFKQQAAVKLVLPESSQAMKPGANEQPPLTVTIDENNNLRVGPTADPVTFPQLQERLRSEAAKNPQVRISVSADKRAHWEKIVKTMDIVKELKLESVTFSLAEAKR